MSINVNYEAATLLNKISNLYLNDDFSDVIFICKGVEIPAHRNILAQMSPIFKSMFEKEYQTNPCFIDIGKAHLKGFKEFLRFIYHSELDFDALELDVVFDVFRLALDYELKQLECLVLKHLKEVCSVDNVCLTLTKIGLWREDLDTFCLHFIDTHVEDVFQHESFTCLSVQALERVVKYSARSTSPDVSFKAVLGWLEVNRDKKACFPDVVKYIDLNVIALKQLACLVRPVELIDANVFADLIHDQTKALINEAPKCWDGIFVKPSKIDAWVHTIGSGKDIIIDLESAVKIDLIEMTLSYGLKCSYIVSTSLDGISWTRLIDHSKYICRDHQTLYFAERDVRYICIRGMAPSFANFGFSSFNVCYTAKPVELDPSTKLLVPHHNVATVANHAVMIEGDEGNAFIDGTHNVFDRYNGFSAHTIGKGRLVLQLPQPYMLDCMKLLLWDIDHRQYSYYVEVSTDKVNWTLVVKESLVSSWREFRFERQPVVFVKIVGTGNTANNVFHCVHIACMTE